MKSCSVCGATYSDNVSVCPVDQQPLTVETEAGTQTLAVLSADGSCPNCGVMNDYTHIVEPRSSFNWSDFVLGGIFAVMLRNAGHSRKVRCNHCETRFYVRARLSIFSRILFVILVAPRLAVLVVFLIILLIALLSRQ